MLKTSLKIAALSVVSLTLLTACGLASKLEDAADRAQDELDNEADRLENERERIAGGNGGNNAPTPPSNPVAAVADSVVSVHRTGPYSNAGTFVPQDSSLSFEDQNALRLDDSYNITATESQDTFALRRSGNNFVMTVNGTAHTLIRREITPATPPSNGNAGSPASYEWSGAASGQLYSYSFIGDLLTVIDGTHATIQGAYIQYSTALALNGSQIDINLDYTEGFATVGERTPVSVVESQTATATYVGNIRLNVHSNFTKTAGQASTSSSVTRSTTERLSSGNLTMTANFTNNTIAGEVTYGVISSATNQPITNREATITFNSAPIVGNGFAGTFTMDSEYRNVEGITNNPTGNYAGNFFGPAADDIAGVLRFDGQAGVVGIGGFRADRETQ